MTNTHQFIVWSGALLLCVLLVMWAAALTRPLTIYQTIDPVRVEWDAGAFYSFHPYGQQPERLGKI